jgi:hypothetical protein
MASTYQSVDLCSYEEKLRRTMGPGMYQLAQPANDCGAPCTRDIPADPSLRFQAWGPNACPPGSAVADSSELRGLNYKNSKCNSDLYAPGKYSMRGECAVSGTSDPRACAAPTEHTRFSNPPCTLHSTGWNRWEWLCWNPQDRAIIPFEWNTSYRLVAKDNHVPCLETPIDQSGFTPNAGRQAIVSTTDDGQNWALKSCGAPSPVNYGVGNPFNASAFSCS